MHGDVVRVHVLQRQIQELVLVLPTKRLLLELFSFGRWQRRFSDLGNKIRGRGFCEAVDKDTNEWNLDEDVEADTEAEQDPGTILEP